ncbi:MAG TPA: alpha/beta fold hydrolase, partial [Pseudomonadales bacterium]|nr:alpha/beta fold hydrolase [Pseudomonadales bacterium]
MSALRPFLLLVSVRKGLRFCVIALLVISSANIQANTTLWPGETIRYGAGYPAVTRFFKGQSDRPLYVFVPGAHHNARIAYGGHAGYRQRDFLAHWISLSGANFLAVSYPIDTTGGLFEQTFPDFGVRDWGAQAAQITQQVLVEEELTGPVIVLGWSMAGKVAQPFYEEATRLNLPFKYYISMAATPPIPGIITSNKKVNMASTGLASRPEDYPSWYRQVEQMPAPHGHSIIPHAVYLNDYVGDISINQQAYGLRFERTSWRFIRDYDSDTQDTKGMEYGQFPLVAMIVPSSPQDLRHSLTDQASWGLYNANRFYKQLAQCFGPRTMSSEVIERARHVINHSSSVLSQTVS